MTNTDLDFVGIQVFDSAADIVQIMVGYHGQKRDNCGAWLLDGELYYSPGDLGGGNNSRAFQQIRPGSTDNYFFARGSLERSIYLPRNLELVARVTGQIADGNLMPTEQLGFGGYNSIRGYDQYPIVGDSGLFTNLELWTKPFCDVWEDDELRLLAFYDSGVSYNHTLLPGEPESIDLGSVGVGLRYSLYAGVSLRVDYAWQTAQLRTLPSPRQRIHVGMIISR